MPISASCHGLIVGRPTDNAERMGNRKPRTIRTAGRDGRPGRDSYADLGVVRTVVARGEAVSVNLVETSGCLVGL
jgi:hypothetical protein